MSKPCENCGSDFRVCISCDLYNGKYIEIPDNATNGEVIKALFKPNRIIRTDDVVREEYEFDKDWWNAPYQKGGKVE